MSILKCYTAWNHAAVVVYSYTLYSYFTGRPMYSGLMAHCATINIIPTVYNKVEHFIYFYNNICNWT